MRHCSPSAIFSQFAQNKKLYTFLKPSADRACIGKHCSKYMGMATRLYGCIVEFGSDPSIRSKIYNHNRKVINGLPQADKWPPLTRNMFTITHNMKEPSPNYAYSGRLIHFGANFKSVEYEWEEWKAKFEKGKDSGFSLKSENSFTSQNKNDLKECQTQQNEGEMITISCQFSGTGDYQVHLVSLKQENNNSKKAFIYLGKLRFRVL